MSNKTALYKNEHILNVISGWFNNTPPTQDARTLPQLFQLYHEYTTDPNLTFARMSINDFAKCLVACKIIDISGKFTYIPEYTPSKSAVTRALYFKSLPTHTQQH